MSVFIVKLVCSFGIGCECVVHHQVNLPCRDAVRQEECASDAVHTQLLQDRVELHNGVWIVDNNVRVHDKVMVKLSGTCTRYMPMPLFTSAMVLSRILLSFIHNDESWNDECVLSSTSMFHL